MPLSLKSSLFYLLLLLSTGSFANMANPVWPGDLYAEGFVNRFARVLHERIEITPDSAFKNAAFMVEYEIEVLDTGISVPFLFYAEDFQDSFLVWVDGVSVPVLDIPDEWGLQNVLQIKGFDSLFAGEVRDTFLQVGIDRSTYYQVHVSFLQYFRADLLPGKHTIRVEYNARAFVDNWDAVQKRFLRYQLFPASHWLSFGDLEILLRDTYFKEDFSSNLGKGEKVAEGWYWSSKGLPARQLEFRFEPEIPAFAAFLLAFGASNWVLLFGVLLFLLTLWILWRIRSIYWEKRGKLIRRILYFLPPFLFLLFVTNIDPIIKHFLGDLASQRGNYSFLYWGSYPILVIVMIVIVLIVGKVIPKAPSEGEK